MGHAKRYLEHDLECVKITSTLAVTVILHYQVIVDRSDSSILEIDYSSFDLLK